MSALTMLAELKAHLDLREEAGVNLQLGEGCDPSQCQDEKSEEDSILRRWVFKELWRDED